MAGTPTPPTSRGEPDPAAARALYRRHAEHYDVETDWAGGDRAKAVSLLELRPGDTVVDVGCGTGLCFTAIQERIGPTGRLVGIEPSVEMLGRHSTGGALVVIVAEVPDDDLRATLHLRGRYGSLTLVHIDRSAWDPGAPVGPTPVVPALRVTREHPFATGWNALVRSQTRRGRASVGAAR